MSILLNNIEADTLVDFFVEKADRKDGNPDKAPDGQSGNKPAKSIKIGEYVPVYDPSTGTNTRFKITNIVKQEEQTCKKATFNSYGFIVYNSSCNISVGDSTFDQNGGTVTVESIEDMPGTYTTYSFELEQGNNYQANDIVININ